MKNWLILGGGILLVLVGVVWTLQGLNVLPGSAMSGATLWAVLGPIVVIVGLALIGWGIARRRGSSVG
ncbi:hypothetical protein [Leifsonia sp. Leaf264]|uniref:hypothetical protein n=1 Tax=Leifsonia sp. Leaf264 TaxID=1736314 RepID=UPI000701CC7D|nr:hypothetical protein [Leifsonia sp. Leaf264]KQP01541.1 hypothetical protein ASF30_02725 [Leifsonia sp. Leaf264]